MQTFCKSSQYEYMIDSRIVTHGYLLIHTNITTDSRYRYFYIITL